LFYIKNYSSNEKELIDVISDILPERVRFEVKNQEVHRKY